MTTLTVVRGAANQPHWVFATGARQVVRVGSGPHCCLQLQASGVRSNHLMLVWNGESLAALETGAGSVYVDGDALSGTCVLGPCRIALGEAVLEVAGPASNATSRRPRRLYREAMPDAATVAISRTCTNDDSATTAIFRAGRDAGGRRAAHTKDAERTRLPLPLAPRATPPAGATPPRAPMATRRPAAPGASPRTAPKASALLQRKPVACPSPALQESGRARPLGKAGMNRWNRRAAATATATAILVRRAQRRVSPYSMSLLAAAVAAIITAVGTLALRP